MANMERIDIIDQLDAMERDTEALRTVSAMKDMQPGQAAVIAAIANSLESRIRETKTRL